MLLADPETLQRVQRFSGGNHYAVVDAAKKRMEGLVGSIEQMLLRAVNEQ